MESKLKTVVRQPTLLDFSHGEAATAQGLRRWAARGQNFCVTWSQATGGILGYICTGWSMAIPDFSRVECAANAWSRACLVAG